MAMETGSALPDGGIAVCENEADTELPPLYNVVLLNDDQTPMDFVVEILMKYFAHSLRNAQRVMLDIHNTGRGVAGTYPRDIAEAKLAQISSVARAHSHPLRCITELAQP